MRKYERLFFCGINDLNDELREMIRENNWGGLILYPNVIQDTYKLTEFFNIIESNGKKCLISSDHEGGQIETIPFIPPFPGNMALGKTRPEYARKYAYLSGNIMKSIGFNTVFAPVLDLYTPKNSAVVGFRTLGSEPVKVAKYSNEMLKGYKDAGVLACVKHFPGHGKAFTDSHEMDVIIDASPEALKSEDFVPFKLAIESGVELIMTAHVIYSSIDTLPATLSKKVINDILKNEFEYDGVVLTDAIEMKAISEKFSPKEILEKFFNAGGDMILLSNGVKNFPIFYKALEELLNEGRIDENKLENSVVKIKRLIDRYYHKQSVGFINSTVEESIEVNFDNVKPALNVILLIPQPQKMSQADVLSDHYIKIERLARKILGAKIFRYDMKKPKKVDLPGDALIIDIIVDTFKNENLLKFHKSLPQNTIYVISHDPYDKKFFEDRNYAITYSMTPVSIAAIFRRVKEFLSGF